MLIFLQAVIKNLLSIFCRCPSKVKLSIYILQNISFSPTHSSKNKRSLAGKLPLFSILHIFCLSVFRVRTCVLHHFTFLVWLPTHYFLRPITRFLPQKTHFLTAILPFLAMFLMVVKGLFIPIAVDFYAFRLAFSSISHCI